MGQEFEFDPAKSAANSGKHQIDFLDAQELWTVPAYDQPSPFVRESRRLRTGKLADLIWTAVYTLRGERVRLISVRRARTEEVATYEREYSTGTRTDQEP